MPNTFNWNLMFSIFLYAVISLFVLAASAPVFAQDDPGIENIDEPPIWQPGQKIGFGSTWRVRDSDRAAYEAQREKELQAAAYAQMEQDKKTQNAEVVVVDEEWVKQKEAELAELARSEQEQAAFVEPKRDQQEAGQLSEGQVYLTLAIFACVVLYILGLLGKAVIFYDNEDVGFTLAGTWILFLGYSSLAEAMAFESLADFAILLVGVLVIGLCLYKCFHTSIKYNGLVLGLFVGVMKMVSSIILSLAIFHHLGNAVQGLRQNNRGAAALGFLVTLMFGWIWRTMINGQKIESRRSASAKAKAQTTPAAS